MLVAVAAEPESATEASDAELAGRVRGGDRAAEAELFRRLAPRVRLYGLRHLRDPAAADDLVQDVLLMTFDSLCAGKVRKDERLALMCSGPAGGWPSVSHGARRGASGLLAREGEGDRFVGEYTFAHMASATGRRMASASERTLLGIVSAGSTPSGRAPLTAAAIPLGR